jgi:hypothetical protein
MGQLGGTKVLTGCNKANVIEQSSIIIKAQKQRPHCFSTRSVAESPYDAIRRSHALDLLHAVTFA